MVSEEKIRNSFQRVKEDINSLKAKISQIKVVLNEIRAEIKTIKEPPKSEDPTYPQEEPDPISTGNQGVHSLTRSLTHSLFTHLDTSLTHSDTTKKPQKPSEAKIDKKEGKPLEKVFYSLTKKEFEIFLLVYQLEEEGIPPAYEELAKRLTLTSGALRSYISSIIKKGAPIHKSVLKNKAVMLYIDQEFKAIASREKLIDMYYSQIDPFQTRLTKG